MNLSIIIPVYNTSSFLVKCVESCENQNISKDDYEIIIINDGSTDTSEIVIDELCLKYTNIRRFFHSNKGLSATRNRGLELANGNYVWFVDSDDWIKENCLASIVNKCEELKLDAFQVGACNVYDERIERIYNVNENRISRGKDLIGLDDYYYVCAPFTIYRRSFLLDNALHFFTGIYHEDCEFTPRAYYYANKISGTNDIIYYVYNNTNSITHNPTPKRAYDLLTVIKHLDIFSKDFPGVERVSFSKEISVDLNLLLTFISKLSEEEKSKIKRLLYENRYLFKHYVQSRKAKYIIEGFLFILFPKSVLNISKRLLR